MLRRAIRFFSVIGALWGAYFFQRGWSYGDALIAAVLVAFVVWVTLTVLLGLDRPRRRTWWRW